MTSQVVEFYVKMKDLMSGGLTKIAQTSQQTFAKVKSDISEAAVRSKFMANSIDELRYKLEQVNKVRFGTVMKSEFREAGREAQRLELQIERLENKGRRRGMSGGILGSYLGTAAIAMGIGALSMGSVNAAANFGATKTSFGVLTGSTQTGDALAGILNKLQQDTILGPEVFKAAQTMMGFGVATKDVEGSIKRLGDISMGDTDKFNGLTLALSNTAAAGRLMGQDLLQYINAGYNPLSTMSEHWKEFGFTTKKTVGDLKNDMEKGLITYDMVVKATEIATSAGGKYFDMMNKMSKTTFGRMKILEGAWENFKIKTGEALIPLAEMFMKVANFLLEHKGLIYGAIAAWGTYKIVSFAALNLTATASTAALGPLGLVALAVGAIAFAWNQAEEARAAYEKMKSENSAKVYDQEKKSMAAEVAKMMAQKGVNASETKKVEEIVNRVKELHLENVNTGLRQSGFELQKYNRAVAGVPVGFIPEAMRNKMINLQNINRNYQDAHRAITDFTAADIAAAGAGATPPIDGTNKDGNKTATGITGGGPRVINITIGKMVESLEIHAASVTQGLDDMERRVEEHFLRILNSGAAVQN